MNSINSMVRMKTLIKIALRIGISGVFGTFVVINSVPFILNGKIRKSAHYKEAVRLAHEHPEVVKYLGEPIVQRRVNTTSREDYGFDENKMWFKVPLRGPNGKGTLFYDCLQDKNANNEFQLLNVEFTLDKLKDYKLIIKKTE